MLFLNLSSPSPFVSPLEAEGFEQLGTAQEATKVETIKPDGQGVEGSRMPYQLNFPHP